MIFFTLVDLQLGEVALVWRLFADSPRLVRVILPEERLSALTLLRQSYPKARSGSHPEIVSIARQLEEYDQGMDINFSVPEEEPQRWSEFYRQVWTATSQIPRGKVSTYGQVASKISHPRAARAVGTALGANPFPLLIPCHRVLLASGESGNYSAGGPTVKRQLLAGEGVFFDSRGRVLKPGNSASSGNNSVNNS
jgi:methylated-DNA-[protein]-cysteine S-methyltransferase